MHFDPLRSFEQEKPCDKDSEYRAHQKRTHKQAFSQGIEIQESMHKQKKNDEQVSYVKFFQAFTPTFNDTSKTDSNQLGL